MARNRKSNAAAMTAEKLRQIQELRRSNAAGPINPRKPARSDDKRRAINDSKDH